MKLALYCKTHDSKKEIWIYDNVSNELFDGTGSLIDITSDERLTAYTQAKSQKQTTKYSNSKSKDFWDLRIQLGLKCNMQCKYCAQSDRENEQWVSSPKDIPVFIEKLKTSGIKVHGVIELWGGEPFVYWKTLQKLVPALRELYPEAALAIITNGTLLTEKKIEFCEKYKIDLTFSHDGPGYYLRGKDPLDDPKMVDLWRLAFSKLHCGINCVLSPANTDIDAIASFFKERLGNIHLNFEGIMTHVGVQDSELIFTSEQIHTLQKNIFAALTKEGWDKFPALTGKCDQLITSLIKRRKLNKKAVKCSMNHNDQAAINLRGDFLSCHDHCTEEGFVGTIDAPEKVDLSKHFKPWSEREKCCKCLVLSMCRGACPQIEGLARSLTCKNEFAYNFAVFQAIFWLLFGLTLESYQPLVEKSE
jgi:uncharacterized protein